MKRKTGLIYIGTVPFVRNHAFREKNMAMEKPWQSGGTLGAKYFIVGRAAWNQ